MPVMGPTALGALPGRMANAIPFLESYIIMPPMLDPTGGSRTRINRVHAQAVKYALAEVMKWHHREHIPSHFNKWRQHKYQFSKRARVTKIIKRESKSDPADLVGIPQKRRGRLSTKEEMTRRIRIRVGGTTGAGKITVTGILRFPPGMREKTGATGVTKEVMADEISRWTVEEERAAAQKFVDLYLDFLDNNLSKRAKFKVGGTLRRYGLIF